jgi:signal transduction histidine kinase
VQILPLAALVAGVLLVLTVVLLLLWLRSARTVRRLRAERRATDADAARLELTIADLAGRLRIIRELLDVGVRQVSSMVSHAEGAAYAASGDPDAAARTARGIVETGRSALADMRRVLTLVRESDVDDLPQPQLRSARELLDVMRDLGLRIRFEETGEPYELSSAAELAVYRTLQEALANCLQYGGPGTEAHVAFTWTPSGLAVRVDDDGLRSAVRARNLSPEEEAAELAYGMADDLRALTQEITGAGLNEMRARAAVFGGTVTATEVPGVGFSIAATFPTIRHHNGVHGVDLSRR